MSDKAFTILGIAGSLRSESYNRALLGAAQRLVPPGVVVELYERLGEIPLFDEDLRVAQADPEPVRELKTRVAGADALLIATPEYNYGIPGVLKNAIDWASRPPDTSPLHHKPVAIIGASTGLFGTVRAQLQLRQVFVFTESYVLGKPEVLVPRAADKFGDAGELTDAATHDQLAKQLAALVEWAKRLRSD
jgi:chromate reductase, NAD(P)H dehydrogenase (quinone)